MRILHTADLHLGKVVNGYSMLEEQAYALDQIIQIIKDKGVEVLIIAGDVYDKRNPSDQASKLFNKFLSDLIPLNITSLIIAGNHDAGVKLEFGKDIFEYQNLFIEGDYYGQLKKVSLEDKHGPINFYLTPFLRPSNLRLYSDNIKTYHEALDFVITSAQIDYDQRNVFIGHQFFASGSEEVSDSEQISVGGIDNVGYHLLDKFDYAALGHLHRPQRLKSDFIRYSGSIVKYSLSEVNDNKSLVLLDLNEKDNHSFQLIPLKSKRQFIHIKAYLADIMLMDKSDDYTFVTLLDDDLIDAITKVKSVFSNLMSLDFDNKRSSENMEINPVVNIEQAQPSKLFADFYALVNNDQMSDNQADIVNKIMERIDKDAS